jgi:hypothetical protein
MAKPIVGKDSRNDTWQVMHRAMSFLDKIRLLS